jgi:DMSO reductase anchor subunit
MASFVAAAGIAKVAWESSVLRHLRAPADDDLHKTARLLTGALAAPFRWRLATAAAGVALAAAVGAGGPIALAVAALALVVAGELLERRLFFTAAVAPRMPGVG